MNKMFFYNLLFISGIFISFACKNVSSNISNTDKTNSGSEILITEKKIIPAAGQPEVYLPILKDKKVALVVNHTAMVGNTHLADTLLALGVKVKKIFAPEHGFRGKADAGEKVNNEIDTRTGLPVISLYGNKKKPSAAELNDIDIIVFDIQDVGARFYTYISTMHNIMEACAENNKPLVILDRPNPNGSYVDGPVLKPAFKSFVGMHPIPVVHGLTVGELAQMINGENWLSGNLKCDLKIVPVKNYTHKDSYSLEIKPSPNLPNDQSIYLYPSLCFFEGTNISVGRGTEFPFQVAGAPGKHYGDFTFTPKSTDGAKNPPFENQQCYGLDLRKSEIKNNFTLEYLIYFYERSENKDKFFNNFFDKLAGNAELKKQIMAGMTEEDIRKTWQPDLKIYKETRKKYLLYPDFE